MIANSTDKKTFQLTDNEELLGQLIYENLFFLKASIKLANTEVYDIKPVGFFGTSISITQNGTEIANLKMNWSGHIVIAFQDGQEYIFKAKGLLASTFAIENKDKELLVHFTPKFNWSKFKYSYDVEHGTKTQDILLILLGIYTSNYIIATMSGATSGMA